MNKLAHLSSLSFLLTLACGSGVTHDTPADLLYGSPITLRCGDGNSQVSVVQGDFNGDHKPDLAGLVIANDYSAAVFLNEGHGAFSAPQRTTLPEPSEIIVYDVNADGLDDLVAVSAATNGGPAAIFISNGDGTFQAPFAQPAFPTRCILGHSLDGCADALCGGGDGTLTVEHMSTDGSAQPASTISVPTSPAVVADVNGDGNLDFVFQMGSTVALQLGQGHGAFGPSQIVFAATATLDNLFVGDIDGDGLLDLVVQIGTDAASETYFFVHNEGASSFKTWSQLAQGSGWEYAFQDVSGDGLMDVIELTSDRDLFIFVGQGDGTFDSNPVIVSNLDSQFMPAFIDIMGSGKLDVVGAAYSVNIVPRVTP